MPDRAWRLRRRARTRSGYRRQARPPFRRNIPRPRGPAGPGGHRAIPWRATTVVAPRHESAPLPGTPRHRLAPDGPTDLHHSCTDRGPVARPVPAERGANRSAALDASCSPPVVCTKVGHTPRRRSRRSSRLAGIQIAPCMRSHGTQPRTTRRDLQPAPASGAIRGPAQRDILSLPGPLYEPASHRARCERPIVSSSRVSFHSAPPAR